MARILCVDDYKLYAEMVGTMLRTRGGHEVKTDIVPLVLEDVREFAPDVVVINLVRKAESLRSAIHDFYTEVEGAKALREFNENPDLMYPLVITALAVEERDVPKEVGYQAFVEVPQKLDYLLDIVEKLARAHAKDSDIAGT